MPAAAFVYEPMIRRKELGRVPIRTKQAEAAMGLLLAQRPAERRGKPANRVLPP
jgi:hypothetical protein